MRDIVSGIGKLFALFRLLTFASVHFVKSLRKTYRNVRDIASGIRKLFVLLRLLTFVSVHFAISFTENLSQRAGYCEWYWEVLRIVS